MDTTIWEGDATIELQLLAACAAPTLWFSPDDADRPTSFAGVDLYRALRPSDAPMQSNRNHVVVYFQLQRLTGGEVLSNVTSTTLRFEQNGTVILRYFLYFSRDATHLHDLERVDVHLRTVRTIVQGSEHLVWRLWPERIVGQAHGNVWYSNALKLSRYAERVNRMQWPPIVLVEAFKHGLVPDRDANGTYTPFVDVNEHVTDAWGLRDSLAAKVGFLAPAYSADMSTPRSNGQRISSSEYSLVELREDIGIAQSECRRKNNPAVIISGWDYCGALDNAYRDPRSAAKTLGVLERLGRQLTAAPAVAQSEGTKLLDVISISAGKDQDAWRFTLVPRGIELKGLSGWIIPRIRVLTASSIETQARLQFSLGYSPSAARWADWYIDAGYGTELERESRARRRGACVGCGPTAEIGMRWKGPARFGLLGARLGLAADYGTASNSRQVVDRESPQQHGRAFQNARLVYDITIGPW